MPASFLALVLGLLLGSFLNVVITRLPRGEAVWAGRSRCPHCGVPLPWHDNVPLLSFWYLGRRFGGVIGTAILNKRNQK